MLPKKEYIKFSHDEKEIKMTEIYIINVILLFFFNDKRSNKVITVMKTSILLFSTNKIITEHWLEIE